MSGREAQSVIAGARSLIQIQIEDVDLCQSAREISYLQHIPGPAFFLFEVDKMFDWARPAGEVGNLHLFERPGNCYPNSLLGGNSFLRQALKIRPYEKKDRQSVRRICCDTAFMGEKIDPIYKDRELFADIVTGPYLKYEPEWALVAEFEGRIIGYVLASVSPYFHLNRVRTGAPAIARIALKLSRGHYAGHPRSERFARWLLYRSWSEEPCHPKGAGHMHFNVEKNFRGTGVGMRIWRTFEQTLVSEGKNHYYGQFLSCPERNLERVYLRYGLQPYSRAKTSIFDREVPSLEMVCMHKWLREG